MNDNPIRISTIKRSAAVAVNFEWMNDADTVGTEFFLELLNSLDTVNDKPEMIELLLNETPAVFRGYFLQRNIVAAGRKINVLRVRFPDNVHPQNVLIKILRTRHIFDFESDMAHSL